MKKLKILAVDKEHIQDIFQYESILHGNKCDLNHIDVSNITDMSQLFFNTNFNGDISKWDVSNVTNMSLMFYQSLFNKDISNWNVSSLKNTELMFFQSNFSYDISKWKISKDTSINYMFGYCPAPIPWWYIEDKEFREKSIDNFNLHKELQHTLKNKSFSYKKTKI